jgi:hypothetical protein
MRLILHASAASALTLTSTFTKAALSSPPSACSFNVGAIAWHACHHVAVKANVTDLPN